MSENETPQPESSGTAAPTPNSMPQQVDVVPEPVAPEGDSAEPVESERSDLERFVGALGGEDGLRQILKGERRWERRAKDNLEKAKKFDEIENAKKSLEERLISERDEVKRELDAVRLESLRERVARETGVPPEQITGSDEGVMRESAEKALAWANSLRKPPAAPPASAVTGDGKAPVRPDMIKSREELKTMTPQQILEADKAGRLDHLKGLGV